jgi:AcrR family transcriptional regulator
LLRAASEEFGRRGYAGATTAAIAKGADVAEIQMFRYFPSKAELFREAIFTPLVEHFRTFNAAHGPEAIDTSTVWDRARLYTSDLHTFLGEHAGALISALVVEASEGARSASLRSAKADLQTFLDEVATVMTGRAQSVDAAQADLVVRIGFGAMLGCISYHDWLFPSASPTDPAISRAIGEFILAGIARHSDLGPIEPDDR